MEKEQPVCRRREDLEIVPTSYKGSAAILVRDHLGLVAEPVLLQGEAVALFGLLDGRRTVRDIQMALVRSRGGRLVDSGLLQELVRELDAAGLLQSPGYEAKKRRLLADYAKLQVREPSHAGVSYPAEPDRLRAYLDSILDAAGEAGPGGGERPVLALVAPAHRPGDREEGLRQRLPGHPGREAPTGYPAGNGPWPGGRGLRPHG